MSGKLSLSQVFTHRGFLNLWLNQILVQLAFNALNFALIIWVFRLTDSNMAVAILLFAIYIPTVILGLFSGVLVDIIDRRKIILLIDLLLCILFISLIYLKLNFPAILFVTFLINAVGQFYSPAEASAIPIIVEKKGLLVANSIFAATFHCCFLIGFGVSGPLINQFGIDFVFASGAVLLAIAFLLALVFPPIKGVMDEEGKRLILALKRKDVADIYKIGVLEIFHTLKLIRGKLPLVTSIAILSGVQMVVGVLAVIVPGFLEKSLQINATDASYVLILPLGLGVVIGGFILSRFGHTLVKRRLVSRAIIFAGLVFFLVGVAPIISPAIRYLPKPTPLPFFYQLPLSKILMIGSFFMGMALVYILVPAQTVLQVNTPEEDRGKVFAVLGVVMAGLSLIPVLLSGVFADLFGTTPIFISLGAVIFLVGLFGLSPSLFVKKEALAFKFREFLGLGHWDKDVS